ncbi:hypothetical protein F52700_1184 [Fusarium sp. NRRL 52700]|nr:hypothetical protein F52700_1184 [Fusarium sp. NRRL 52700]
MKSHIIVTTVLGASGVLSRADHGAMKLDTWCVTYLSTYLVPVSNPGKSTGASSLQPTFAGNSSVPVTQTESQSALTFDTTLLTSDVTEVSTSVEVEPSEAQSSSETVSFDSTTGTLTDQITTAPESTITSDVFITTTSIIEPPGRTVIFLISAPRPNTRKRQNTDKGFVGNDNPSICTFAQSFNLAEEQLFINGVPFFYDGEDYKELVAGPAPPAGAVTKLFRTNGRSLEVDLSVRDAGFCLASDGTVYATFTSRPAGCEVVILEVYDERQCQNGRIVGLDTTTSVIETTTSESNSSESTISVEASATTETVSSSDDIAPSSSVAQSQSVGPVSQTTESEASSSAVASSPISPTTSIATSEVSTQSPASSSVTDETTTDEVFPTTAPSLVSTTTEVEESTSTETSESSSEEITSAATTEVEQSATETTTAVEETTENSTVATTAEETTTEGLTTAVSTTEETTVEETTVEDVTTEVSTIEQTATEETTAEATTTEDVTTDVSTTEETSAEETTAEETTTEDITTEVTTTEEATTEETTTTAVPT